MFSIDKPKFKIHRYIVKRYQYIYVYETGTNKKVILLYLLLSNYLLKCQIMDESAHVMFHLHKIQGFVFLLT